MKNHDSVLIAREGERSTHQQRVFLRNKVLLVRRGRKHEVRLRIELRYRFFRGVLRLDLLVDAPPLVLVFVLDSLLLFFNGGRRGSRSARGRDRRTRGRGSRLAGGRSR